MEKKKRKLGRGVAIVGAGVSRFGAFKEKTTRDLFIEAFTEMKNSVDKGIETKDVEALFIGNFSSDLFEGQCHVAPIMADWIGLIPKPAIRVEDACASGALAIRDTLAEVHDCFTIAEIVASEDIGFFKPGGGIRAVEEGITSLKGIKPINTSGGLKAKGHPIGASGVGQVVEIWQQMRGEAGERQVPNVDLALTHNVGATGGTCVLHIYERR